MEKIQCHEVCKDGGPVACPCPQEEHGSSAPCRLWRGTLPAAWRTLPHSRRPGGVLFQALEQLSPCPMGFDLSCWSIWKEISDAAGNNFAGDSEVLAAETSAPPSPPHRAFLSLCSGPTSAGGSAAWDGPWLLAQTAASNVSRDATACMSQKHRDPACGPCAGQGRGRACSPHQGQYQGIPRASGFAQVAAAAQMFGWKELAVVCRGVSQC